MEQKFSLTPHTHYHLECRDKDGNLRWEDTIDNIVVTTGMNQLIDANFKTGLAAPAWFVGLVGTNHTYDAANTLASHAAWDENANYTGDRKAFNVSGNAIAAGALSNSNNKATFVFTGTANPDTINGAFLTDQETGNIGILYGVGDLSAARTVYDGDTLTVTVTVSVS